MSDQEISNAIKMLQAEMSVVKTALKSMGLENLDLLVQQAMESDNV